MIIAAIKQPINLDKLLKTKAADKAEKKDNCPLGEDTFLCQDIDPARPTPVKKQTITNPGSKNPGLYFLYKKKAGGGVDIVPVQKIADGTSTQTYYRELGSNKLKCEAFDSKIKVFDIANFPGVLGIRFKDGSYKEFKPGDIKAKGADYELTLRESGSTFKHKLSDIKTIKKVFYGYKVFQERYLKLATVNGDMKAKKLYSLRMKDGSIVIAKSEKVNNKLVGLKDITNNNVIETGKINFYKDIWFPSTGEQLNVTRKTDGKVFTGLVSNKSAAKVASIYVNDTKGTITTIPYDQITKIERADKPKDEAKKELPKAKALALGLLKLKHGQVYTGLFREYKGTVYLAAHETMKVWTTSKANSNDLTALKVDEAYTVDEKTYNELKAKLDNHINMETAKEKAAEKKANLVRIEKIKQAVSLERAKGFSLYKKGDKLVAGRYIVKRITKDGELAKAYEVVSNDGKLTKKYEVTASGSKRASGRFSMITRTGNTFLYKEVDPKTASLGLAKRKELKAFLAKGFKRYSKTMTFVNGQKYTVKLFSSRGENDIVTIAEAGVLKYLNSKTKKLHVLKMERPSQLILIKKSP